MMTYYSTTGTDQFLDKEIFPEDCSGFFIEVGAYDGLTGSNTYFLEHHRQWKGICIDALADVVPALLQNRTANVYHACISSEPEALFFENGYDSGVLSWYNWKKTRASHVPGAGNTRWVECVSFNSVLQRYAVTDINYCSISVMGYEIKVLESIDFLRANITVFSINNGWGYGSDYIRSFMAGKGYVLVNKLGEDEIYIQKICVTHE